MRADSTDRSAAVPQRRNNISLATVARDLRAKATGAEEQPAGTGEVMPAHVPGGQQGSPAGIGGRVIDTVGQRMPEKEHQRLSTVEICKGLLLDAVHRDRINRNLIVVD